MGPHRAAGAIKRKSGGIRRRLKWRAGPNKTANTYVIEIPL
jgi:hypothetical protein